MGKGGEEEDGGGGFDSFHFDGQSPKTFPKKTGRASDMLYMRPEKPLPSQTARQKKLMEKTAELKFERKQGKREEEWGSE